MKKYCLIVINLVFIVMENIAIIISVYNNPSKENVINIIQGIVGILIACIITIGLISIMEMLNKDEELKSLKGNNKNV